jgi:predicted RNA binding protein YcfA (HicA-like mRNA interferase family)
MWPSRKAKRVLIALLRIGWSIKRHPAGSHRTLSRLGYLDYTFAYHDDVEIGPRMLSKIGKQTGLEPADL